ncbi:cytochrome P450 [Aspergillus karnatakaensis]|uniref:cytochrome P450 n=1 Tax=Aspergillus karnatakaensis TaxID=1810916 RepID=UPI003CCD8593
MAPFVTTFLDFGQHGRHVGIGFVAFAVLLICRFLLARRDPNDIPYVGQAPGKAGFSLRTYLTYYTDCSSLMREAYDKYLSKGKAVWIPGLGARKELILPNTSMKWALAQPSRVLNHRAGILEVDFPKYLLGNEFFLNDPWHGHLVRTELQPMLDGVCEKMNEEINLAFNDYFGDDTENWKEIDVLTTARKIIGRAASRFTVGEPLCQDEEYIMHNYNMVDKTHTSTGALLLTPSFLHPIIGRFIRWRASLRFEKLSRMIEAEYYKRLEILQHDRDDPNHEEPNDFFQVMMRYAQRERPNELNLHDMTVRLFLANLGSMHRTAFLVTNVLLNIVDSKTEFNTVNLLRDEISRVLKEDGLSINETSAWNRARSLKLFRTESVGRETMRLQSFDNRSTVCKVMTDGVTTPEGIPLPRGVRLSFLAHPAQIDEGVYEDANKFDPFRFSRPHEAAAESEKAAGLGAQSFVSTGPYHLPFGHGRAACPGRWLVDFESKMIAAYAVSRYELEFPSEYQGKRPSITWMVEAMLPPKAAKIRVKRRKE